MAPRLSQQPMKVINPLGKAPIHAIIGRVFPLSTLKPWLYPNTEKASPSRPCKTHNTMFIAISFQLISVSQQGKYVFQSRFRRFNACHLNVVFAKLCFQLFWRPLTRSNDGLGPITVQPRLGNARETA